MLKPLAHTEFISKALDRTEALRLGITREEMLEGLVVYLMTSPGQFRGDTRDEDLVRCLVVGIRDHRKMLQDEFVREHGHLLFETTTA